MSEFNSDDHYIDNCGQESLRKWSSSHSQQKSQKFSTSVQSQKQNNLCFQCKSFIITVTQVYALITNAKEAEVERFCEDLQDLLKITPKKKKKEKCPFHHGGLQCKSRKRYLE